MFRATKRFPKTLNSKARALRYKADKTQTTESSTPNLLIQKLCLFQANRLQIFQSEKEKQQLSKCLSNKSLYKELVAFQTLSAKGSISVKTFKDLLL